jgi:hypothetical protein
METQSIRGPGWFAVAGCVLGALSLICLAAAFILPIVLPYDRHGFEAIGIAASLFLFPAAGGLLFSLSGMAASVVALARSRERGLNNAGRGIVMTGFLLNGLAITAIVIFLLYFLIFTASTTPPAMVTPSPLVPVATPAP